MRGLLVIAVAAIGAVFVGLTLLIVLSKAWRDWREQWCRRRRRTLEPKVRAYAQGVYDSVLSALDGHPSNADRAVLEEIFFDLIAGTSWSERGRAIRAFDQLGYVDRYLDDLHQGNWWERASAAERLGRSGARRTIDQLAAALGDEVAEVRLRAAAALGVLGGVSAVRPLIHSLSEDNRWATIRIADIITDMGPDVVDELVAAFPELNENARVATLEILAGIGDRRTAPWLRERLDDDSADVCSRAAAALGAVGDTDAGPRLQQALEHDAWPVRAMAAKSLGMLLYAPAIADLCDLLRDREWWVRINAAEALRTLGPDGLDALERMLGDRDEFARHQAVLMLEEAGVLDEEVDRLTAIEPARRSAAQMFVGRCVEAGQFGRLRELSIKHPDPQIREILLGLIPADPVARGGLA
ncbi:MAG: hypothetical protein GY716_17520 [bacterium]|nr:hypothetical protein [bacterium]